MASSLTPENVPRSPETKPIRVFEFDVVGTGVTITTNPIPVNGVVKGVSSKCKTLATDTTYQIQVLDADSNARYDRATIPHNSAQYDNLINETTANRKPFICFGNIRVKITFPATSQTLSAGDLQVFLETTKH